MRDLHATPHHLPESPPADGKPGEGDCRNDNPHHGSGNIRHGRYGADQKDDREVENRGRQEDARPRLDFRPVEVRRERDDDEQKADQPCG
jgi:hypothetical protein